MKNANYCPIKAWTCRTVLAIAVGLFIGACSLVSCSDKYEVVEPQTLKYEVTGNDYYAVIHDQNAPKAPYLLEGQREIKGVYEIAAKIGDSVNVTIMAGGAPWQLEHAHIAITLGTDTIFKGNTEKTGYLTVSGVLGKQFFVERKK